MRKSQPIFNARSATLHLFLTILLCYAESNLSAAPARFWLSLSDTETNGPEVPVLNLVQGTTRAIYVWAQPQTDGAGFQDLRNLSLNLNSIGTVSSMLDIEDDFQIFNPGNRFELVRDSDSPSDNPIASTNGIHDSVLGLSAGIAQTSMFTGIGAGGGDNTCLGGAACDPAWLVAQFNLTALTDTGSSNLRLQIGSLGMNHDGEFSDQTEVIFGEDQPGPIYNAKMDRGITFGPGSDVPDTADLVVNAIPVVAGDFTSDSAVNGLDFLAWQRGVSPTPLSAGDLSTWASNYGGTGSSIGSIGSVAVPEPSSVCFCVICLATISTKRLRRTETWN